MTRVLACPLLPRAEILPGEWGPDYEIEPEPPEPERPRDRRIDEAKEALLHEWFEPQPERIFYERQIEVRYELQFYHWITARALGELVAEGRIGTALVPLVGPTNVRFYWYRTLRYWKRGAEAIRRLIIRYSRPEFTRALGRHGETMFDAALPTGGFLPKAKNVREFGGRRWEATDHDLDRVFERDGVDYGIEIKNTLVYIDRRELAVKLAMCEHLRLRPLFIMRAAAKSYIHQVNEAGGYVLVFRWQLYPFGSERFAAEVNAKLGLPVDCPRAIESGTIQRLVNWHDRQRPV